MSKRRACNIIVLAFVTLMLKQHTCSDWSWQRSNSCIIMQSSLVHFPSGGVRGSTRALHCRQGALHCRQDLFSGYL